MTGTIYLGGGGDADDEALLWRGMLSGTLRVTFWPFALPRELVPDAENWLDASLRGLGFDLEVDTWTDLRDHDPTELAATDLLFVGGGNTFALLEHVRTHGFLEPVRQFVADGGDYYGGSAGAVLACRDIGIAVGHDPNDVGLTDLSALGLLPDVAVLPHFTPDQLDEARRWGREHDTAVLGIPERSGVVDREGRLEVAGPQPVTVVQGDDVTIRGQGERWWPPQR